ncbi:MAG: glycosyltransferase [Bacteroidia bacterium]
MISFIIIGRNERWKLTKCIDSVYQAIKYNSIDSYEVIYVDSQSSDDSLERAKQNPNTKVFQITGTVNAAIARNIGAKESKGNILFFIDGDMEIEADFLPHVLNENGDLIYDCVTGHLNDLCYDTDDNLLCELTRTYDGTLPKYSQKLTANGGIFIIKRECWEKVGGMRTKYRRSQDLDLTIRLNNIGVETIRIPFLITKHHTVDYLNEKRMWKFLFSGDDFYSAVLFKHHLLNYEVVFRTARSFYTSFLLLFSIVLIPISFKLFLFFIILYILGLIVKVYSNTLRAASGMNKLLYFFERLAFQFIRDVLFWFAIFFFFPGSKDTKYVNLGY